MRRDKTSVLHQRPRVVRPIVRHLANESWVTRCTEGLNMTSYALCLAGAMSDCCKEVFGALVHTYTWLGLGRCSINLPKA